MEIIKRIPCPSIIVIINYNGQYEKNIYIPIFREIKITHNVVIVGAAYASYYIQKITLYKNQFYEIRRDLFYGTVITVAINLLGYCLPCKKVLRGRVIGIGVAQSMLLVFLFRARKLLRGDIGMRENAVGRG